MKKDQPTIIPTHINTNMKSRTGILRIGTIVIPKHFKHG